ncbi:hypothetical protein BC829DRAFT_385879 [Chytridium lagenaria]|nr:hypothetical protein BC829DRAFT_385879 [Chytridium lagenaria]
MAESPKWIPHKLASFLQHDVLNEISLELMLHAASFLIVVYGLVLCGRAWIQIRSKTISTEDDEETSPFLSDATVLEETGPNPVIPFLAVHTIGHDAIGLYVAWISFLIYIVIETASFTSERAKVLFPVSAHLKIAFSVITLTVSLLDVNESSILPIVLKVILLGTSLHLFSVVDDIVETATDAFYASKGRLVPSRERSGNVLAVLFFSWLNPTLRKGERRTLKLMDIPDLRECDKSENVVKRFERYRYGSLSSLHFKIRLI